MTVRGPIVVWPVRLTCAISRQPSPTRYVRADRAIRTDQDVFSDRGPGFDPRRGIDHMRAHASDIMAPTSASATTWPATFASPRYHHIVLRRVIRSM